MKPSTIGDHWKGGEDPAEINRRIRSLLAKFTHSSYVGFTATPFANVFIDPDTKDEMLDNDLFPRDFIYGLEPPSNYVGPQVVFGDDSVRNILRPVEDADAAFPAKHKSSLVVTNLPDSLLEAARSFLIATTLRDLRVERPHSSFHAGQRQPFHCHTRSSDCASSHLAIADSAGHSQLQPVGCRQRHSATGISRPFMKRK